MVTTVSGEDLDFASSLGASKAIDNAASYVVRRIDRAPPEGYDLYLDASGTADPGSAVDQLANGGRLVVIVGLHGTPTVPLVRLYGHRGTSGYARCAASRAEWAHDQPEQ